MIINVHEAKNHFSKLLARVANVEAIVIAKSGKPVGRPVPIKQKRAERVPGIDKGNVWMAPDFEAPLYG